MKSCKPIFHRVGDNFTRVHLEDTPMMMKLMLIDAMPTSPPTSGCPVPLVLCLS